MIFLYLSLISLGSTGLCYLLIYIYNTYCKDFFVKKPNKDCYFRILANGIGDFEVQFSYNDKKYYHFANFRSKEAAIAEINLFFKKGEEVYKYDPFRLRITDGSEKEFEEIC